MDFFFRKKSFQFFGENWKEVKDAGALSWGKFREFCLDYPELYPDVSVIFAEKSI
jgi:hypothetical protein